MRVNCSQLGHWNLHYAKLPKQQYSLHTVSCTSTMYVAMYVANVNSDPIVGCSDIDKNVTATGTTCEGNIS